jgi:hypothetical protein
MHETALSAALEQQLLATRWVLLEVGDSIDHESSALYPVVHNALKLGTQFGMTTKSSLLQGRSNQGHLAYLPSAGIAFPIICPLSDTTMLERVTSLPYPLVAWVLSIGLTD